MFEFIVENPLWVGGIGGLLSAATFMGWVQSANKAALWISIAIAALTIIGVASSFGVETPKMKIEKMLHQMASDLESNNIDALIARIHPTASETVNRARSEIRRYKFSMAKVTRIRKIEVDEKGNPPKAFVEMNVVAEGSFEGFSGKVPRYIELTLYKKGDEWMIADYSHQEPLAGFR